MHQSGWPTIFRIVFFQLSIPRSCPFATNQNQAQVHWRSWRVRLVTCSKTWKGYSLYVSSCQKTWKGYSLDVSSWPLALLLAHNQSAAFIHEPSSFEFSRIIPASWVEHSITSNYPLPCYPLHRANNIKAPQWIDTYGFLVLKNGHVSNSPPCCLFLTTKLLH